MTYAEINISMIDNDYEVIDDFLSPAVHNTVIDGVDYLYNAFVNGTGNGNEFNLLATIDRYRDDNVNTMPVFLKTYIDCILHDDTNLFFQNVLYLKDAPNGLHWHVDSQIGDRIIHSDCINHSTALEHCTPSVDLINVYYPTVSSDINGGQFCMDIDGNSVSVDIKPNRMIKLKGNIRHRVLPIQSQDGIRISMITEQMHLPDNWRNIVQRANFEYNGTFEQTRVNCTPCGSEI